MNDRPTNPESKEHGVPPSGSQFTEQIPHQSDTYPVVNEPISTLTAVQQKLFDSTKSLQFDSQELYPQQFGAYELLEELARGGMGVVYKAKQSGLDRIVALKMILGIQESHAAKRFIQEARATASLDHPNIVPIFDVGEHDGRLYFTMPFVDGPSLKILVEESRDLPISKVLSLFIQIVAGMAHAHRRGIVHRDLKPANILVDTDGRPRVADFGLAKKYDDAARMELTGTGQIMGTPAYMSPEQAQESKDVTPSSDVYSLGAILYFMLTRRAPFIGTNVTELLIQVVTKSPDSPSTLNRTIPPELDAICLKCLAKSPADRYPHAMALAEALSPLAQKFAPSTQSLTPLETTKLHLPDSSSEEAMSLTKVEPYGSVNNRRLILFVVAGFFLIAGATVLISQHFKKPKQEIVQTIPDDSRPDDSEKNVSRGENIINTQTKPDDRLWPDPIEDFKLSVNLVANAQKKDQNSIIHLANKAPLQIELLSAVDCWVYVFVVDSSDQAMLLFPYPQEQNNQLIGGVKRTIPSHPDYVARATPTVGEGYERIRVIGSTVKLPDPPPGQVVGNFRAYVDQIEKAGLQNVLSQVRGKRGIEIVKKDQTTPAKKSAMSEAELRFRVDS